MALPALIKMFSNPIQRTLLPVFPQSAIHSLAGVVKKALVNHWGTIASMCLLLAWIIMTYLRLMQSSKTRYLVNKVFA